MFGLRSVLSPLPFATPRARTKTSKERLSRHSSFSSDLSPEEAVEKAFEEGKPIVDLSYRNLKCIPAVVFDLKNIVHINQVVPSCSPQKTKHSENVPPIFTPSNDAQLFLANNLIETIPLDLFSLIHLTVLSLRAYGNNNIKSIPREIRHLKQLQLLSIGGNQIETLPIELCTLNPTFRISAFPNPFLKATPQDVESLHLISDHHRSDPTAAESSIKLPYSFEHATALRIHCERPLPTLIELCVRNVASNPKTRTCPMFGLVNGIETWRICHLVQEARGAFCGGVCDNRSCQQAFCDAAVEAIVWGSCGASEGSGKELPFEFR
ncbi:hypothetical protein BJ741DRAFT_665271 [Chytriomyces cf. hyalinus JEL632]|nr:hypothetical protein BJ741DRAFT_665271 [Chytriomyces cf. hyalinus JEL632]